MVEVAYVGKSKQVESAEVGLSPTCTPRCVRALKGGTLRRQESGESFSAPIGKPSGLN